MTRLTPVTTLSPERQLDALLQRFDPKIRALVRAARAKLRRRLPTAIELVYENARALAISFASTERRGDVIVSLAVYASGVNLYFIYGVALADPHGLLQGSGNQGRFVRLDSAGLLDRPEIDQLIAEAINEIDTPLARTGRGRVVIKSIFTAAPPGAAAARRRHWLKVRPLPRAHEKSVGRVAPAGAIQKRSTPSRRSSTPSVTPFAPRPTLKVQSDK